jgi:hypothetical protein
VKAVSGAHGPTVYAAERRERAEVWLDDLRWHRHMCKESRFRWTGATGTLTPAGLERRVADARQLRGEPGDPRPIPAQLF